MTLANLKHLVLIALVLGVPTVLMRTYPWDLQAADVFFDGQGGWKLEQLQLFMIFKKFGVAPGLTLGIGALVVWLAGYKIKRLAVHRSFCLFLWLTLAIGPGLIVNVAFKEYYGRPRPDEVFRYGGKYPFEKVWDYSHAGRHSFPSGHASIAFFLLTPWFWYRNRRRNVGLRWLVIGLAYGCLMGVTRMGQGGHWLSDTFWSFGFVYLTGWILSLIIGADPTGES